MTIHLYQQTKEQSFCLCEQALLKLGFSICLSDINKGWISATRQLTQPAHFIYFDVRITQAQHSIILVLISNVFAGSSGVFIADTLNEELFLETIHEMLCIPPPGNPLKLSHEDYAMAEAY